jgi:hypothetical protein
MDFKKIKKLKVGGQVYDVLWDYVFRERTDLCGQQDISLLEIRVADLEPGGSKRKESNQVITFIHEVLHAIDGQTAHKLFENNEKACDGFAHCIYQILIDNGLIVDPDKEGEQPEPISAPDKPSEPPTVCLYGNLSWA